MNILRFRILPDAAKGVFRDLEIASESTFLDLHHAVLRSFEFSGREMASFYVSDDEWEKGEEITLMDMQEGEGVRPMDTTPLTALINTPGDRLFYLYDFMRMWIFYVELIAVEAPSKGVHYPRVSLAVGDAPAEQTKDMEASLPGESIDDLFGSGPDDFDEPFDNLDDYDGEL